MQTVWDMIEIFCDTREMNNEQLLHAMWGTRFTRALCHIPDMRLLPKAEGEMRGLPGTGVRQWALLAGYRPQLGRERAVQVVWSNPGVIEQMSPGTPSLLQRFQEGLCLRLAINDALHDPMTQATQQGTASETSQPTKAIPPLNTPRAGGADGAADNGGVLGREDQGCSSCQTGHAV